MSSLPALSSFSLGLAQLCPDRALSTYETIPCISSDRASSSSWPSFALNRAYTAEMLSLNPSTDRGLIDVLAGPRLETRLHL